LKKWHDFPDYLAEFLPRTDTFPDLPDLSSDSDSSELLNYNRSRYSCDSDSDSNLSDCLTDNIGDRIRGVTHSDNLSMPSCAVSPDEINCVAEHQKSKSSEFLSLSFLRKEFFNSYFQGNLGKPNFIEN
jgi:hypothetical protein